MNYPCFKGLFFKFKDNFKIHPLYCTFYSLFTKLWSLNILCHFECWKMSRRRRRKCTTLLFTYAVTINRVEIDRNTSSLSLSIILLLSAPSLFRSFKLGDLSNIRTYFKPSYLLAFILVWQRPYIYSYNTF